MRRNRQSLLDLAKKASQSYERDLQQGSAQQDRSTQNQAQSNQGFQGGLRSTDIHGSLLGHEQGQQQAHQHASAQKTASRFNRLRRVQANTQSSAQMDAPINTQKRPHSQAQDLAHNAQRQPQQQQTQQQSMPRAQPRPQQGRLDPDQPILDLFTIFAKIWSLKWMIIAFGILGCLVGVAIAVMTPHTYTAEASLIVDPRDIQVTETKGINSQASSQILLAVVDSQIQLVRSTRVVEETVKRLGLNQDSEFNGEDGNGLFTKIKGILSGEVKSNDGTENAITYLRKYMNVTRDTDTFLVYISMQTKNADKSALVANTLVEEYLKEYSAQQSGLYSKASTSIDSRLEELRSRLDLAENEVVEYQAINDIIDVGGGVINTKEMLALSDEVAKVRAEQINKTVLANELQGTDLSGVISGSFPQAALTITLGELRKQYSQAKSKSDALAAGLGPRHPQFIAAQTSVTTLEGEIKNELRRIISSTQREVQRTAGAEKQLVTKLDVLKARASDQSSEYVGLRELERKATAIRGIYESLLKRARETTERGNLETASIQLISTAEKPAAPSSRSRKITVLIFGILGGFLGFAIAAGLGAIQSLKASFGKRNANGPTDIYFDQNEPYDPSPNDDGSRNGELDQYYEQQLGEPTDFPEPPFEPAPHARPHPGQHPGQHLGQAPYDTQPFHPDHGHAIAPPHHPSQYAPAPAGFAYQPHPAHQAIPQPMPQAAPQFGHYPYTQPIAPAYPQAQMMPSGYAEQGHHAQAPQQAPAQAVNQMPGNQIPTTQIYVHAQPSQQMAPQHVPQNQHAPTQQAAPQQMPNQHISAQQVNSQQSAAPNAPVDEHNQTIGHAASHQPNITQLNTRHVDHGNAADYQRLRGDIQRLRQRLETWSTDRA
jgi:succinoglycan biosynthesis transport protein ExoP